MGSFLLLFGMFGFDCDDVVGVGDSASPFDASSLEVKESEMCGWHLPRFGMRHPHRISQIDC